MKTVTLNGFANDYLHKCLLQGSSLVEKAAVINLDEGIISTYLPEGATEAVTQFKSGGFFNITESREAEEKVANEIMHYLMYKIDRCVIFDDLLHHPGERSLGDIFYVHYQGQVFLYADRHINSAPEEITAVIRMAGPWPFIALLTRWTQKPAFSKGDQIGESDALQLVSNIEGIIVNAWDDEGFLIWRRGVIPKLCIDFGVVS